jgi:hypothetical protein
MTAHPQFSIKGALLKNVARFINHWSVYSGSILHLHNLFYSSSKNGYGDRRGKQLKDKNITVDSARQIAVEYLKKQKNVERAEIAAIEQNKDIWVIRGTCPIDLEGHPWAEKFEVIVDTRGKVRAMTFALL